MTGLRGPTVNRSNPRTRRSTRSCGKVFLPAILPAGRSPKSVRRGDGSPIGRRTAFANTRCSCSTARELFSGAIARRWRDAAVRGRGFCARSVADNLQRALAAIGEEARPKEGSLIEGVEATRSQINASAKASGKGNVSLVNALRFAKEQGETEKTIDNCRDEFYALALAVMVEYTPADAEKQLKLKPYDSRSMC
jgi:hypothetical protein